MTEINQYGTCMLLMYRLKIHPKVHSLEQVGLSKPMKISQG